MTRSALQKCELSYNSWPQFVSAIQTQPGKLTCPDCETSTCEPLLTSTADSKFVLIEFSPELMNMLKMYENITVGQSEYRLRGMVRSHNRHFTCAVLTEGKWTYIDDLCLDVKKFSNLAALKKHFAQGWFFLIFEVSNMACESQLYELDKEYIEASIDFTEIPIKKRKHFKSGVKVETPLTCCNYYDVLIEDNNVLQVIGPKSNFIKGQFPSNKLQQQNIPKPKDKRKRKTVSLNVTTKKKAKLSPTIESSNNSKVKNEMPIHFAKQDMTKFHYSIKYTIYHCNICREAWPLKTKPKNCPNYICSCCSRDKSVPKKFSNENFMIPSPVPKELQGLSQFEEMLIARAFPVMHVYTKPRGGQRAYKGHVITLPQNVQQLADVLPQYPKDLLVITFTVNGKDNGSKDFVVRHHRISDALNWLTGVNKQGHFLYKDVKISAQKLAELPENGVPLNVPKVECGMEHNDQSNSDIDIDSGPVDFDDNEKV